MTDIQLDDIDIQLDGPFLEELQTMIHKLPPQLNEPNLQVEPLIEQIKNKEFCYAFLYSMKNGPITNKNPTTVKIYNNILDYYGVVEEKEKRLSDKDQNILKDTTIELEDGLVVVVVVAEPIAKVKTQKRPKENKKKKQKTVKTR